MMKMPYRDIVLRDYRDTDIEDEVRWFTEETSWMVADTPWEPIVPVDPEELKQEMWSYLNAIKAAPDEAPRSRLEIEYEGRHLGFVSSYFLNDEYEPLDYDQLTPDTPTVFALGIEICEPEYRGRGIGTKALTAFMEYYRKTGIQEFALETWSGNTAMMSCAEKAGFREVRRVEDAHEVDGELYDALVYALTMD